MDTWAAHGPFIYGHPLKQFAGYTFTKPELLAKALSHPSAILPKQLKGFERLEFLGDRVLGLIIAEYLYAHYPREKEGDLARRLGLLVSRESCLDVALQLNLSQILRKDDTALAAHGSVLADALEAILGAVYLDGGLSAAREVILSVWGDRLTHMPNPPHDPKTALQEIIQGRFKSVPQYSTLSIKGPDHAPCFRIRVTIPELDLEAEGLGPTKKQAERKAALTLLEHFKS